MSLSLQTAVKLNSGYLMPMIGFGVWDSPQNVCATSVFNALKAGYRHVDSAQYYRNEAEMGEGVRKYVSSPGAVPRKDIFVTTKMQRALSTHEETIASLRDSVKKVDLDGYVDLFLIHGPGPATAAAQRQALWEALEQLASEGGAKSIGVSNYGPSQFEEMRAYAKIWPSVNQIELHPWCQQPEVVAYCNANGIAIQAYCPLVRGEKASDPSLTKIAKKHGKSWAQVLIRWSLQKGFTPLPKSDKPERIISNVDVYDFVLDDSDMAELDSKEEGAKGALVRVAA